MNIVNATSSFIDSAMYKIIERLGFPITVTLLLLIGGWKATSRLIEEAIVPMAHAHIVFVQGVSQITESNSKAIEKIGDNMEEQTKILKEIARDAKKK